MGTRLLLCFTVLLLAAAAEGSSGSVVFWSKNVTLTCPLTSDTSDSVSWYNNKKQIEDESTDKLTFEYENKKKGHYYCSVSGDTYHFYIQGKVCENCFELNGEAWGMILVGDMVLTVLVMVIVYKCTKSRSSPGRVPPRAGPGGRAPPVPSPDYEPLNLHNLSRGT